MKLANVVEFTLTTLTLAVWVIACTAAFQATSSTPTPTTAPSLSVPAESAAASAPLVEARLSVPAAKVELGHRI